MTQPSSELAGRNGSSTGATGAGTELCGASPLLREESSVRTGAGVKETVSATQQPLTDTVITEGRKGPPRRIKTPYRSKIVC